jgi:hypothetical protein
MAKDMPSPRLALRNSGVGWQRHAAIRSKVSSTVTDKYLGDETGKHWGDLA